MRCSRAGRALGTVALLVLPACARPVPPARLPAIPGDVVLEAAAARAVVSAFIALEARNDENADTLLLPGADFIASGMAVRVRPRLAGMTGRGEGTIEEARTQLAREFAWTVAVYRWVGRTPETAERARATFVLERREAGWRIRHVHSSMVERWELRE